MQRKHVDHIRELFAPSAGKPSEVATGPSTVGSAARAVPREDAVDELPETASVEDSMTPTLVTEQPKIPHSSETSVPSGPNRTPVCTYPHRQRKLVDRFTCT